MARATRSSTAQHLPAQKKRKRTSSLGPTSATKLQKTDDPTDDDQPTFLAPADATKILDVLELSDTQGLLDRVFPSGHAPDSLLSLRTLLERPAEHPLTAVKAAINHLFPISSLPRSRPSPAASQQLAFSNLALSLLEQASRNSVPVSLDKPDILEPTKAESPHSSPILARRKYALVQHLPSGDYWSSLSTQNPSSDIRNLSTGHAELVAIIPTACSTALDSVPTLGSLSSRPVAHTRQTIGQRRVTTGHFLDYGPYTSFAPCFDNVGGIVGQGQLSEVLYHRVQKKQEAEQRRRDQSQSDGFIQEITEEKEDIVMHATEVTPISDEDLNSLLPPEDAEALKDALGSLELENAVQTLLERNALALKRLGELQRHRLSSGNVKPVEEGSEEWETAQCIMDSIATLASLRPRTSGEEGAPLIPSPAVLRKLHRSLALEPSAGWYGTLPASRATALHDDSTIKVKSPTIAPAIPASTPVPNTAAPSSQTPAPTGYPGYTYNYGATQQQQQAYRPAAPTYAQYKPGQGNYYQPYIPATTQQSYYSQQSYGGTSNQQPYGSSGGQTYQYGSWYNQYQPTQNAAAATTAGTKPGTPTATAPAASYNAFFTGGTAANGAPASRPPAVGNTVSKAPVPQNAGTWSAPTYQAAASVPSHLRPAPSATPSPHPTTTYQQQGGYYQYQPQTSVAPSR